MAFFDWKGAEFALVPGGQALLGYDASHPPDLYLAFGSFADDEARGREIGRRIKRAFEEAGFTVEWNGSIKTRLLVNGLRWQRRSPT